MDTGQMLDFLATLGRPRLTRHDDGKWSAAVKFPAPKGVTTEVASDFNHPTHESALIQLISRVRDLTGVANDISRALATIDAPKIVDIKSMR